MAKVEAMLLSREGNRMSGVALAMRHRLCDKFTYTGSKICEKMSTPPTDP